jgi:hypothetical protein
MLSSLLLYIGPGLGIGTILLVLIVLLIVAISFGLILWIPIKNFFKWLFSSKAKTHK